jgi:hypothetical protein
VSNEVRIKKPDHNLLQNDGCTEEKSDILAADADHYFWLMVRQAVLIILAALNKYKAGVKSKRCESCGKML